MLSDAKTNIANRGEPISTTDEVLAQSVGCLLERRNQDAAGKAFMELYDRHAQLLRAFVSTRTGSSDTDDVTQEIWQRVWQYLPTRFHGGNFRGWLYEVARNYLIDCSRRRKNRPELKEEWGDTMDQDLGDAGQHLQEAEEAAALANCLEKLKEHDATSEQIVRARLAGENYTEVSRRLGLTDDRAYSLFHQAKKQLNGCVERRLT